ncbi:MAG: cytochrome b/b6 domain-containing protein [Chlamydiota bacterium]|nr:cytochrome b/b6 domain-containing protein [Chlamydiota bacterium]
MSAQDQEQCLICHADTQLTSDRDGKEHSLFVDSQSIQTSAHSKLECTRCHVNYDAGSMPHTQSSDPVRCSGCHTDVSQKHLFHPSMKDALDDNDSCKSCHGDHSIQSLKSPEFPFRPSLLNEKCGMCHPDAVDDYKHSAHDGAKKAGIKSAPNCLTCHEHPITKGHWQDDDAQLKITQEKLCLSCHLSNPDVISHAVTKVGFIAAYEESVHGAALIRGNAKAANCVNCHHGHDVKQGSDPSSSVNKARIPKTCAVCHSAIAQEYSESIHAVVRKKGNEDAPVCTDCHGEHNILRYNDPKSLVAVQNVSTKLCSGCHASMRLSEKYGIQSDRLETYQDSYHGLAMAGGSLKVANCASCHGVHNIKPSNDPASMIFKDNLIHTCGKCHPGANQKFTKGLVHVTVTELAQPILFWISQAYTYLIIFVVGFMILHNLMHLVKHSKLHLAIRRGYIDKESYETRLYLRMSLYERLQHFLLMSTFITLAITGFFLSYPDAWWVVFIREQWSRVFELRSIVHRVAASIFMVTMVWHLIYITFTVRGRALIYDLFPVRQDVLEFVQSIQYNFGLSKKKPLFGRFSYIEKMEYWALVWGSIIMVATGLIMWFENYFLGIVTKLGWDIARTVHFYEAWLAVLAVIVWHIYFVIFNPAVYPMNIAWIKGTLSEVEMAEEHPRELDKLKELEDEDHSGKYDKK